MTTNGTLDTRLSQNLVKEFEIPANKEYDKFNPHKIGGGNAIWITHIPPNVKVWFSTNQNFDNAQRLDYMNRGMRYAEIGSEGITRIYDNFYIFTEGTDENDIIKICVSTYGSEVEPILSSNTNQIDQVDAVGKIGAVDLVKSIESIKQLYFKPPMLEIKIQGQFEGIQLTKKITKRLCVLPLGKDAKLNTLGFNNDKWYRIKVNGHADIGGIYALLGSAQGGNPHKFSQHLSLFNINNDATLTPITDQQLDNFYSLDKSLWANAKNDLFDIFGIMYMEYVWVWPNIGNNAAFAPMRAINNDDIIINGAFLNSFDNIGLCYSLYSSNIDEKTNESHASLLVQFYELETL